MNSLFWFDPISQFLISFGFVAVPFAMTTWLLSSPPLFFPFFFLYFIFHILVVLGWLLGCLVLSHTRTNSGYSWKLIWTMQWVRWRRMHIVMGIVARVAVSVVCPLLLLHVLQIHLHLPMCLLPFIWSSGMLVLALSPLCPRKEMWLSTSLKVT